jgi:hypothetical protein
LNIIEQLKSKKEENYKREYGHKIEEANKNIHQSLTEQSVHIKKIDEKADELMKMEASEIRALRMEFMNKLKSSSPFSDINGNSPEMKIINLEIWKKSQNGTADEIEKQAIEIESKLINLRNDLDAKTAEIRSKYDELHQELHQKSMDFKINIDSLINSASKKIRSEGFMDSALLNSQYQKTLKSKNSLLQEMYSEDNKMKILNQEIRLIRETLNKLR